MFRLMAELAAMYPLDGIQSDRARYLLWMSRRAASSIVLSAFPAAARLAPGVNLAKGTLTS